jgi:CCR4-NOT transcription complex subunit 7/8
MQRRPRLSHTQLAAAEHDFIKDVWAHNLEEEMENIRDIVDEFPYVAMDTEFPGVVAQPTGSFKSSADYHYQTLRCNVDLLKIIQLGLTFSDGEGNYPVGTCTWQFNFKFSLSEDMYAQESIDLLRRSGIDFKRHEKYGMEAASFGELLMSSGIVLFENVRWVSFHSGYDFAYLMKLLTCKPLPSDEKEFFELIRNYFPTIYDIKYLMQWKNLKGGLSDLAEYLAVPRIGPQHQAGSDSLLTEAVFFKLRELFFDKDQLQEEKYKGVLFGLGGHTSITGAASYAASAVNANSLTPVAAVDVKTG